MAEAAPKSEASRLAHFMGLRRWSTMNDIDLVQSVETGLPLSAVRKIVKRLDPEETHLRVVDIIPKATYYRIQEKNKRLNKDQSEKVVALSKVFSETLRLYHGDRQSAISFLVRNHPLLDGRSPLNVAKDSTVGADLVLKLLQRAEAGVAV